MEKVISLKLDDAKMENVCEPHLSSQNIEILELRVFT